MPLADTHALPHTLTALRVDDLGLAPLVLHRPHIADPYPVREPGAHGLDDRLLGGKVHRQETLRPARALELRPLLRQQQAIEQTLAEARVAVLHALRLQHVDPNAEYHARA